MKNKEKGITLIALIITIIVMLILVGVTINVALNGGLFQKAKSAADGTQKQVSKEQLISAMVAAYNNNGKFVKEDVELPEETKWCNENETYENAANNVNICDWVVTKQNEKFYIGSDGGLYQNPYRTWGLTSNNVIFDTLYSGTSNTQGTASFKFYNNGSIDISWSPETITKTQMEDLFINTAAFFKGNIWYMLPGGNIGYAFIFNDDKTVTGYFTNAADANDLKGSIIDNGSIDGTYTAQTN